MWQWVCCRVALTGSVCQCEDAKQREGAGLVSCTMSGLGSGLGQGWVGLGHWRSYGDGRVGVVVVVELENQVRRHDRTICDQHFSLF